MPRRRLSYRGPRADARTLAPVPRCPGPATPGDHSAVRVTRSRQSAKAAGARHERAVADYLATYLDDRIDRRPQYGAKDRGDIGGVRHPLGGRVVVECKDYGGRVEVGPWLTEAEVERVNDGNALAGVVVAKRRGVSDPAAQVVMLTLGDLVALLTGNRDHLGV